MNAPARISTAGIAAGVATIGFALAAVCSAGAAPSGTEATPARLVHASAIRADLNVKLERLPRKPLTVSAPTTTDVVESFVLLSGDLLESHYVPADRGLWYEICGVGAPCISPAPRYARAAADLLPRRLALELALRTFIETDAEVVAVSLPTTRLIAVVFVRAELERELDFLGLSRALSRAPLLDPPASLQRATDELTRPRTFLFLGIEPGLLGGPSWAGMPRWPAPRR